MLWQLWLYAPCPALVASKSHGAICTKKSPREQLMLHLCVFVCAYVCIVCGVPQFPFCFPPRRLTDSLTSPRRLTSCSIIQACSDSLSRPSQHENMISVYVILKPPPRLVGSLTHRSLRQLLPFRHRSQGEDHCRHRRQTQD